MRRIYLTILISVLVVSCAQIDPLTGGDRDRFAPKIDSAGTYPYNGQLNFKEDEVVIKFDEFVALANPNDNIIITPQMKVRPDISSKNKKVKIKFKEDLQPNTTYSISFNKAVTDITEKNDSIFQFVFSTGPYIDSLSISGKITDGFTNVAEKEYLVALYPADSGQTIDSVAHNYRPTYIGQSDDKGSYTLNYLKEGKYFLFAIKDENRNLKLNGGEKLAYYSADYIELDSVMRRVNLRTFSVLSKECKVKNKKFLYPGKVEFTFTNEPDTFSVNTSLELVQEDNEANDSLTYWLRSNPESGMRFRTNLNGELDTMKIIYKGVPEKDASRALKIENNVFRGKLLPDEDLIMTFSEPLGEIPDTAITVTRDSIPIDFNYEIVNLRELHIKTDREGQMELTLDSLGITSWYGNQNEKTTRILFEHHKEDYYGTLIVNLDSMINANILVELIDKDGKVIDTAEYAQQMRFEKLRPVDYQMRLIFDDNNDGEWSSGSLIEGRQPERVIYFSGDMKVKSRWEKEIDWEIKY